MAFNHSSKMKTSIIYHFALLLLFADLEQMGSKCNFFFNRLLITPYVLDADFN